MYRIASQSNGIYMYVCRCVCVYVWMWMWVYNILMFRSSLGYDCNCDMTMTGTGTVTVTVVFKRIFCSFVRSSVHEGVGRYHVCMYVCVRALFCCGEFLFYPSAYPHHRSSYTCLFTDPEVGRHSTLKTIKSSVKSLQE